jgi:peptidylprolyl isomerase
MIKKILTLFRNLCIAIIAMTVFSPQSTAWEKPMGTNEELIVMTLEYGDVVIRLRPDLAPNHVARIKELVEEGFYDGLTFHRVVEGFVAQTGDPTGKGTGGSGQNIDAEFSDEHHVRGVVSMARAADINSADSQFFICLDDATFLDGSYTIWGEVISGMEHVDKIKRGEPVKDPDKIISMKILK